LIDGIKGVFLSFELITVNVIINDVNHKYNDRPHGAIMRLITQDLSNFFTLNHKSVFSCSQHNIYKT
jgi:hypothetical protein